MFTHKYDSVWNKNEMQEEAEVRQAFVDVSFNKKLDTISLVTFDHNIIMCKAEDMEVKKQVQLFLWNIMKTNLIFSESYRRALRF